MIITTYKGIDIDVDVTGIFSAHVPTPAGGKRKLTARSMEAVKNMIRKALALNVGAVLLSKSNGCMPTPSDIVPVDIVGVQSYFSGHAFKARNGRVHKVVYVADADFMARAADIFNRAQAIREEWKQHVEAWPRLTPGILNMRLDEEATDEPDGVGQEQDS